MREMTNSIESLRPIPICFAMLKTSERFINSARTMVVVLGCLHIPVACSNDDDAVRAQDPKLGSTLSVDDNNGVGTVGDERLSLAEAIALANGTLARSDLSTAEQAQVQGDPGAGVADRIQVSANEIVLPDSEPTASSLPHLIGNEHDHLDGQGVLLKESGETPVSTAFIVASSALTIENFEFDNLWRGILIDPQGPIEVHDVSVRNNRFLGISGSAVEISGSRQVSGSSLREIAVDDNEFSMPASLANFNYGVAIRGCQLDSPDYIDPVFSGTLSDVWLEGIYLRRNTILGGAESVVVNAGSIHGKGEISDCGIRRLVITDNRLGGSFDMLININTALAYAFSADPSSMSARNQELGSAGTAAELRNVVIEDVEIARNRLESAQTAALSLYPALQSISSEDPNLTVIEECVLRNVRIEDNTLVNLEGERTICSGIAVMNGHFDYTAGGLSKNNEASNIEIVGNSISGCESGIRIVAGEVIGGGGESRNNRISNVKIQNNRLSDNNVGLQLLGAEGLPPSSLFEGLGLGFPYVGILENNVVEAVEIMDNEMTGNDVGFEMIGGRSVSTRVAPGDTLRYNALKVVTLERNSIKDNDERDCVAESNIVDGEGGGIAEENAAPGDCVQAF